MIKTFIFVSISSILLIGCQKKIEVISSETVINYMPLEVGKYIMYQLDSTVFTNLGTKKEIHSYIIKDTTEAIVSDNLGRKAFRISRLIRNKIDTTSWLHIDSYLAIADSTRLEIIESNKRFIKLQVPIKNGFYWKGNSYINTISLPGFQYLNNWEYTYEDVSKTVRLNAQNYPNSISIQQRNDTIGVPSNRSTYSEINYSKEIFSKNIGLIYKEFLHEVWQPSNANNPAGYYEENSYGIKISILKHNFASPK
jgi:hypothetical protein